MTDYISPYRSFLTRAYPTMKKANPYTPIMIREAVNIEPRVYARYEFGVEKVEDLKGKVEHAMRGRHGRLTGNRRTGRQGDRGKSHRSGARRSIADLSTFGIGVGSKEERKMYILYNYADHGMEWRNTDTQVLYDERRFHKKTTCTLLTRTPEHRPLQNGTVPSSGCLPPE